MRLEVRKGNGFHGVLRFVSGEGKRARLVPRFPFLFRSAEAMRLAERNGPCASRKEELRRVLQSVTPLKPHSLPAAIVPFHVQRVACVKRLAGKVVTKAVSSFISQFQFLPCVFFLGHPAIVAKERKCLQGRLLVCAACFDIYARPFAPPRVPHTYRSSNTSSNMSIRGHEVLRASRHNGRRGVDYFCRCCLSPSAG